MKMKHQKWIEKKLYSSNNKSIESIETLAMDKRIVQKAIEASPTIGDRVDILDLERRQLESKRRKRYCVNNSFNEILVGYKKIACFLGD